MRRSWPSPDAFATAIAPAAVVEMHGLGRQLLLVSSGVRETRLTHWNASRTRRPEVGGLLQATTQQTIAIASILRAERPPKHTTRCRLAAIRLRPVAQLQSRAGQRGQSVVGQRGAHRGRSSPARSPPLHRRRPDCLRRRGSIGPDAAHGFFSCFFSMTIGLGDWHWRLRGDSGSGKADAARLAGPWPPPCGCCLGRPETTPVIGTGTASSHFGDQARQVLGGRRQEASGQVRISPEYVAVTTQDPEDLAAHRSGCRPSMEVKITRRWSYIAAASSRLGSAASTGHGVRRSGPTNW